MQLWRVTAARVEGSGIPEEILQVLEENYQVFQVVSSLPPHRRYDHAIALKEGATIPNLRPYHYPYY